MNYYLDLFTPETWAAFREHGAKVSGFRDHQRKTADHVRPGDKFICYLVRLSRWCGILEVKSKAFVDSSPIFSDPDPFVIRFEVQPIVVPDPDKSIPILDPSVWSSLSITDGVVRGVSGWAQHANLRASLRQMNEADGRFLANLLSEQAKAQKTYEFSAQDRQRIGQKASIRTADRAVIVEVPANEITKEEECEQPAETIRDSLKVQSTIARIGAEMGFRIWVPKSDKQKVMNEVSGSSIQRFWKRFR